MDREELVQIFDRFLNETGNWNKFEEWLEEQGYSMEELGFTDDL